MAWTGDESCFSPILNCQLRLPHVTHKKMKRQNEGAKKQRKGKQHKPGGIGCRHLAAYRFKLMLHLRGLGALGYGPAGSCRRGLRLNDCGRGRKQQTTTSVEPPPPEHPASLERTYPIVLQNYLHYNLLQGYCLFVSASWCRFSSTRLATRIPAIKGFIGVAHRAPHCMSHRR